MVFELTATSGLLLGLDEDQMKAVCPFHCSFFSLLLLHLKLQEFCKVRLLTIHLLLTPFLVLDYQICH